MTVTRYFPEDDYGNPAETVILTPSGEEVFVESTGHPDE